MVNWSHSWLRPVENAFEKFYSTTKGNNDIWMKHRQQKSNLKKKWPLFQFLNMFLLTASICVLTKLIYTAGMINNSLDFLWTGRTLWSLSIGYIVFACVNGQGGIINRLLSHPCWQPLSRLTFNIYLIHLSLLEIIFGNRQAAYHRTVFTQVNINSAYRLNWSLHLRAYFQIQEYFFLVIIACGLAVIVALAIEMPITNLIHQHLSRKRVDALVAHTRYWSRLHTILSCIIHAENKENLLDSWIVNTHQFENQT